MNIASLSVTARLVTALTSFTLLLNGASPAFAQRANGPYSGLFGGQPSADRTQGLDLTMSLFGAYDENTLPTVDALGTLDPRLKQSGASVGTSGALIYDRSADRGRFTWNGGGSARQYESSPGIVAAYNTGSSLTLNLGPTLVLNARAGAAYSPFFQFSPFQDQGATTSGPIASNFGFAAVAQRNVVADGSIGLTGNLTARTSFSASIDRHEMLLLDSQENSLRSWGGQAGVRHRLTRALGVHLEYGQEQVTYAAAGAADYRNSSIDAGVDYNDTLTFARRTALTFRTSTTAVRYSNETHYRLNGSARLSRGFKRSWNAAVGYNRDTQFQIGFRQPLLTDSIDTMLAGLLSQRVKWSVGGAYTRGAVGFNGSDFTALSASSRLDFALIHNLGLYGQYAYYGYAIPAGSSDIEVLSRLSRQTATVGLSVWVPIINDRRRQQKSG